MTFYKHQLPRMPSAIALGTVIFVWCGLFVWQGLDFTDMGYLLVTYQQFYSAPESNIAFLVNWLTAFMGYWMGEPFGGTVVIYKLGACMIQAITGVVAYLGLSNEFGRSRKLAVFIFIACLFSNKAIDNWVGYNNLTGLFYTLGGVLLYLGLANQRRAWVIMAGVVLGANLFIRFPNILGIGLVVVALLHGLMVRRLMSKIISDCLYFIMGWLSGVGFIRLLIWVHGHDEYVWQGLQGLLVMASNDSSHHSSSTLLSLFLIENARALLEASRIALLGIMLLYFVTRLSRTYQYGLIVSISLTLAVFLEWQGQGKFAVPGLLYLGLAWIVWKEWRRRPNLVLLVLIAMAVLVLAPLGSNVGLRNAIFGSWLALPLLLAWLWQHAGEQSTLPFVSSPLGGRFACIILAIALTAMSLVSSWFYTYRDSSNRLLLTHSIPHPLLTATHTTEARARVVSELLAEVPRWIRPGDQVLAYPDIPMVHYLTMTVPWLNNPWPLTMRAFQLKSALDEKSQASVTLPVVVRTLGLTRNFTWPSHSPRHEEPDRERERAWREIDDYVNQHGYDKVWSNEFFEILVPQR